MLVSAGQRYAHIDGVRALAALLVVWIHVSESFAKFAGAGHWLHDIARGLGAGTVGVLLFFIVSGFVIPASFSQGAGRLEGLRMFAIRRFFRLYPAYWLSIAGALVTTWWAWRRPIDVELVAANITMLQRIFGQRHIQGLYWTLEVELIFYVLCMIAYAAGLLHRERYQIVAACLSAGVYLVLYVQNFRGWLGDQLVDHHTLVMVHGLSFMFLGTLLRRWHDGEASRTTKLAAMAVIAMQFALWMLAVAMRIGADGELIFPRHEGGAVLAALLFICLGMMVRRTTRTMAWLGLISYSIYLFHPVIFYAVLRVVAHPRAGWPRLDGLHLSVYLAVCLGLTILVSAAVYRWLEAPAIELGRRLAPRRRLATRAA